jgi:hypothetical protein
MNTGFDHAVFRDTAKRLTAQAGARMQAIPELMYFLDKDPTVSAFFRNRESWCRLCLCVCVWWLIIDSHTFESRQR